MRNREDQDIQSRGRMRLPITIYGYVVAVLIVCLWRILKLSVRVRHIDRPAMFLRQTTIDCAWHQGVVPYSIGAMRYSKPYVWMNHPAWYMKGVHIFLGWMGVGTLVLGSSGHGGRRALQRLVPLVEKGSSTCLNPDGPYGPARVVKDGVLDLAQQTGLPIVAIRIYCSRALRLPSWDQKLVPLPGSRVELIYSSPWHVTAETRESVRARIQSHLNGHGSSDPWTADSI